MFSREIKQSHYVTPRTVKDAFGPYQHFELSRPQSRVPRWVWAMLYGVVIALAWYGIVFIKAGAQ